MFEPAPPADWLDVEPPELTSDEVEAVARFAAELAVLDDPAGVAGESGASLADARAAEALALPPGPQTASLLAQVDRSTLSDAGRLDYLEATERLARWVASLTLPALVDHLGDHLEPDWAPLSWQAQEQRGRVVEVAKVVESSESWVQTRWWLARETAGPLRATGAALRAGEISERHALALVESVSLLSDEQAVEVEQRVLSRAAGRSASRFRQLCRNAVHAVDADAVVRRHREKVTERSVTWWPEEDGMASLRVYASAPDVMAIYGALDVLAGPREADDPRTVGARRLDALLAVCLAAVVPDDASDRCGVGVVKARAPRVEVQVVVDLATLLGLADNPTELVGYGTVPAGVARDWLGGAQTWRRLVTDPVHGHLLDYGPSVRFAPDELRAFVQARDRCCSFPGCARRAHRAEIDHHPPWRPDANGGRTSAEQTAALCDFHHHLRTHAGWTLVERRHGRSRWRSPSGREYEEAPPRVLAR